MPPSSTCTCTCTLVPPGIGIFDSGLGGLTVFHEIALNLPGEALIYFGDTARVPYGIKSEETVTRYAFEIAHFLMKKNIKALIVACNTATAYALSALTDSFKIPVIGVIEPGITRALEVTKNQHIGIIGTEGTIRSGAYHRGLQQKNPKVKVISQACPLLVPLVEEGWFEDLETEAIVRRYLAPLVAAGVDTLILGCTHYPLLKKVIQRVVGSRVVLVDSAQEVARTIQKTLKNQMCDPQALPLPSHRFYVTDAPERFQSVGRRFLGGEALSEVEKIVL
ncbi:MAG: glutamate racemase [Deltaproteobacteria bacterium RIFCSPLOWO2_02_FULL_50_16]|nr:MAG: glutamate racemase [Deltaproteobacteria bacterium GWA2_50_8]OGQ31489.1 MAG: glutamate racemase [Deltaproteobacteria bacterium RIFCSPHIGHO2_02_FULL_50_15]OGQ57464.1 MAG: glutamate racemase [Deltaproteobacteria bacterium RIFCSPLOWO2_02_FULL_50_16]